MHINEFQQLIDQMYSDKDRRRGPAKTFLVGALTSLLEPMLMIFLGVVIGGLVIAMYLPIFKLAGVVGG